METKVKTGFPWTVRICPYSLGKLMKWKQIIVTVERSVVLQSLLVRETNEMETWLSFVCPLE